MENKEKVLLPVQKPPEPPQDEAPVQSANTLFRFFDRPEFLFQAIEKCALIPRYYGENIDYLNIDLHQAYYPMICFCDITIHRLEEHLKFYGQYGIAFSKEWGVSHGIQPIAYVNDKSILCSDFSAAFSSAMERESENVKAANFLLTLMYYIKPIKGTMPRADQSITKNFTDECEWRYIPDLTKLELPQIVFEEDAASVGKLNETISDYRDCWLNFEYTDIKYIILPDEELFSTLCDTIEKAVPGKDLQQRIISKIILWSDAKEDF